VFGSLLNQAMWRKFMRKLIIAIVLLVSIVSIPWATAAQDNATPEASPVVVRDVLGSDQPDEAPGELLELSRYTIPAGFALPVHKHPGVQMATVESGTLTYHVVSDGVVIVTRADGTSETGEPGSTLTFEVGDSWVEPEGMIHWAENKTDEPVILLSTSLFEEGQPASEIVEEAATPAA
jgi:quercetin dioxygenase-like cupin family protein